LSNPYHANNNSIDVTAGRGIEKHVDSALVFGVQRKLEVRCFLPIQSIVENFFHGRTVDFSDEVLNKIAPQDFAAGESSDLGRLVVPLVHPPFFVNPKNRCIGCVDEILQLFGNTRLFLLG
jgi:hypothetical protein